MRVLLADDHALFRESFALVLNNVFPAASIDQVNNWYELKKYTEHTKVDLLLVDLFMPCVNDWEINLMHLIELNNGITCVISASDKLAHIEAAFTIGVRGYVCKTASISEMKKAIEQILDGKLYIPPAAWQPPTLPVSTLKQNALKPMMTARQKDVLELLAAGGSNKEIAKRLFLTESTVKRHVYNIFMKLKAKNRTEAVKLASQQGLLHVEQRNTMTMAG